MNTIFKKILDTSRKFGIDRFVMEDEYVIGGYDLVEKMDYDKWVAICNEINSIFLEHIDKNEYHKSISDDNTSSSFCIKSDDGDYYFEDITLSFLPKRTLNDAREMLELLDIPYILKDNHIEIDKKILNKQDYELSIYIMPPDGDCDGLDAFQYVVDDGNHVSYVTGDFYHLLEEFSRFINCDYISKNNNLLYHNKKEGYLTRRKNSELLKSLLKVNNITFSQVDLDNFLVKLNHSQSIKVFVNKTNKYTANWGSDVETFEYEAELISAIKKRSN